MQLLVLFCTSCWLSAALSDDNSPQPKPSASIVGTVTFEGDVPKAAGADNSGVPRPLLAVDPKSRGLHYAVAYLTGDFPRPIGDEPPDPAARPTLIDQEHETFVPRVVAIQDRQRVRFKNSDGGNHNVRTATLDPRNEFNVFTGAGTSYEHAFHADPKQRPVRIGCDLHPWMRAWVYVFDHPYFAVTDEKGRFEIKDVPAGTYRLVVRQPDGGLSYEQSLSVNAGESSESAVRFTSDDVKLRSP